MLHNLIVVADGNTRRPPVLPRRPASEIRRCRTVDDVVTTATGEATTCIVLAGALAARDPIAQVRAAAIGVPIVAVTGLAGADADVVVSPRDGARGHVARVVRYLLGEPLRRGPRVLTAGRVRVETTGEDLALIDLSEGGVRVVRGDRDDGGDHAITVTTEDGLVVTARARVIRRHGADQAVFAFIGLHATDPRRLRGWMVRAGESHGCG